MEKLKNIATGVFENNPDATECFVTSDGQAFLGKNSANLHATRNATGKVLKIQTFENSNIKSDVNNIDVVLTDGPKANKLSATDAIAAVGDIKTLVDLNDFEATETVKGKGARFTVIAAIGEKRAELTPKGGEKIDDKRKNDDQ